MVGIAAASLVSNQMSQAKQSSDKKQELLANAEATRYGNLTGAKTQQFQGQGNTPTAAGTFASNLAAGGQMYQQKVQNDALKKQQAGAGQSRQMISTGNPYDPGTQQYNLWDQMGNGTTTA
jgi:hypothetical protein